MHVLKSHVVQKYTARPCSSTPHPPLCGGTRCHATTQKLSAAALQTHAHRITSPWAALHSLRSYNITPMGK